MQIIFLISHVGLLEYQTTWYSDCATIYHHVSTQQAVRAAKHHGQNAYLTAMYGHYIEGYFNNYIRLQSQRFHRKASITTRILGIRSKRPQDGDQRVRACANRSLKLAHFCSDIRWFPTLLLHYTPLHILKSAGETVSNATVSTSPPDDHSLAQSRHVILWRFAQFLR